MSTDTFEDIDSGQVTSKVKGFMMFHRVNNSMFLFLVGAQCASVCWFYVHEGIQFWSFTTFRGLVRKSFLSAQHGVNKSSYNTGNNNKAACPLDTRDFCMYLLCSPYLLARRRVTLQQHSFRVLSSGMGYSTGENDAYFEWITLSG